MDFQDFDYFFLKLHDSSTSNHEMNQILDEICGALQDSVSKVEAQVLTARILDNKHGILKFIHVTLATSDDTSTINKNEIITKSFNIVEYLVVNFTTTFALHVENVTQWCIQNVVNETSIRTQCLKVIQLIINNCQCYEVDMNYIAVKLKEFVDHSKKLLPTITNVVLCILGDICKIQPESVTQFSDWILDTIMRFFNNYEAIKNKSETLVEGCFNGLTGYLTNFKMSQDRINYTFRLIINFSTIAKSGDRNVSQRAAINLFCYHYPMFGSLIIKDAPLLLKNFSEWIEPDRSPDNMKIGLLALTVTYRQISVALPSMEHECAKELFNNIREGLEKSLRAENNSKYSHKHAIIGLSELSNAYTMFTTESDKLDVLHALFGLSNTVGKEAFTLSIYVESISKFVVALINPNTEISQLCQLSILLIEKFPDIPSNFQLDAAKALKSSFALIFPLDHYIVKNHIYTVLYQGLIRSCGHQLHADVQLLNLKNEFSISYQSFVPLWKYLLNIKRRLGSADVGQFVYDIFVNVFIDIISKLDFTLLEGKPESLDPSLAFEAKSPADFQVFINLVDLFVEVIPDSDSNPLEKWIPSFFTQIIPLSRDNPVVSGFYKIISVIFKVISNDFIITDVEMSNNVSNYLLSICSLIPMLKDDLLISCLKVILWSPKCFIVRLMDYLDTVIMAAVRIGFGYPDLLHLSIFALDRWLTYFPMQVMNSLLKKVLPGLSDILQTSGNNGCLIDGIGNIDKKLKVGGKVKKKAIAVLDRQLLSLQKQFIIFLGKLDPSVYSVLSEPRIANVVPFDNPLRYRLPLHDIQPMLELNRLMPRIISLALSSGERSTRVTACELLHVILLIAIERTQKPNSNVKLLQKLLTTALSLSCDSDKVVCDLFNPLLLQCSRYFSGKIQLNSPESAVFIEVLVEGCCHPYDSSLRDFSALCIREFVSWARRQNSTVSPSNIQAIIRIITIYSDHPDHNKRLAAAAIFNNIYAEIREEPQLLSTYWFQLYHCFIHNYGLCNDEESSRIIKNALKHILRPLVKMQHIFIVDADNRRVPKGFKGPLLIDLISYTFSLCDSLNKNLRKLSREMFMELFESIPGLAKKDFIIARGSKATAEENQLSFEEKIIAIDYVNWINEVDSDFLLKVFSEKHNAIASELLNFILEEPFPDPEITKCLLKYFTFNTQNILLGDIEKLALLLFKLKCDVRDEFCSFLIKLGANVDAMSKFKNYLPKLDKETIVESVRQMDVSFFIAFDILDSSLLLTVSYAGHEILSSAFNSTFTPFGKEKEVCKFLEPRSRMFLQNIFKYTSKCGIHVDVLKGFLTNKSVVFSGGKNCAKGDIFFDLFQNEIVNHLLADKAVVDTILEIAKEDFRWMLDLYKLIRDKANIDAFHNFSCSVLQSWDKIKIRLDSELSDELVIQILSIISSKRSYGCFLGYENIINWTLEFLSTCKLIDWGNLEKHVRVFGLLKHVSSYLEVENVALQMSLSRFRTLNYSLFSLGPKGPMASSIKEMYKHLLLSLQCTGSIVILNFIAENITGHLDIIGHEIMIKNLDCIASIMPVDHVRIMCDHLLNFLLIGDVEIDSILCVQEYLFLLLSALPQQILFDFFKSHLSKIHVVLMAESTRQTLKIKLVYLMLLELLYFKTSQQERGELQKTFSTIPSLFKDIITKCSSWQVGANDLELWRLYHCACVKVLCSFVCQTNQEKMYNLFLFGQPFWKFVTNMSRKYDFGMDFSKLPRIKNILTSLRQKNRNVNQLIYPKSLSLFDSSLREDMAKFDLNDAIVRKSTDDHERILRSNARVVKLEIDCLNEHEIVASICGVIEHMVTEGITPKGQNPCWLTSFVKILDQYPPHMFNCKLLVLKIIYNIREHVRGFADECTPAILKSIIDIHSMASTNYFIMDLLIMIISWAPKLKDGSDLTKIIEITISSPNTTRKDIFKSILDVIKAIVENWKDVLIHQQLAHFLIGRFDLSEEFDCYVTLYFASVLLACKIIPNESNYVNSLMNWLLSCVQCENKNYQLASEVLGQALNYFRSIPNFDEVSSSVFANIISINVRKSENDAECITRLSSIHKFYPEISSNEHIQISLEYKCMQNNSDIGLTCLEMILSHVKRGNAIYEAKNIIMESLKSSLSTFFVLGVELFLEYSIRLEKTDFIDIAKELLNGSRKKDKEVRLKSCAGLIRAFNEIPEELQNNCKNVLLKCLNDVDPDIRQICESFWIDSILSHKDSKNRLLSLWEDLYSPFAESDFVTYSSSFIMASVRKNPAYNLPIFDDPLAECSYKDFQVLKTWRARHASLVPLFAPSVTAELGRLEVDETITSSAYHEGVKATARSLMFSPTISEDTSILSLPSGSGSIKDDAFKVPAEPKKFFRFYKTNNTKASFARRAIAAKEEKNANLKEKLKLLETDVKVFRSYRIGDYPDIQIKHSELITLLLELTRKDILLSKEFFSQLFLSITKDISDYDDFWLKLEQIFNSILENTSYDPLFLSTMFELAIEKKIFLSTFFVNSACKASGLFTLGTLVIEHNIILHLNREEAPPKKRKEDEDEFSKLWLNLVELFQELQDIDGQQGVFLDKLQVEGHARNAINEEAELNWFSAEQSYKKAMIEEESDARNQFYGQCYLRCLTYLCDWSRISESIAEFSESREKLHKDPWSFEAILPLYLRSELVTSLANNTNEFQNIVNDITWDPSLSQRFNLEFTLASWLDGSIQKTLTYFNQSCLTFLNIWSQINNWDVKRKQSCLMSLQFLQEVNHIIRFMTELLKESVLEETFQYWSTFEPNKQSDLIQWDMKLAIRKRFVNFLEEKSVADHYLERGKSCLINNELKLTKTSLVLEHFPLAKKYLKVSKVGSGNPEWISYRYAVVALSIKLNNLDCCNTKFEKFYSAWQKQDLQTKNLMNADNTDSSDHTVKVKLTTLNILSDMLRLCASNRIDLSKFIMAQNESDLKLAWLQNANEAVALLDSGEKGIIQKGEVYVEMAKFYRRYSYPSENVAEFILKSMQCNNLEAKQLFPWLLTMDLKYSEDLFSICRNIPTWMFLSWRHQLLAFLAKDDSGLIKQLIRKIAQEYPKSLSYSFRVSLESYSLILKESTFVNEIRQIVLSNPTEEAFVSGLSKIVVPFLKFKYFLGKVGGLQSLVEITQLLQLAMTVITDGENGGVYKCLEKFKPKMEEIMLETDAKTITEKVKEIIKQVDVEAAKTSRIYLRVKLYSPWLASYQGLDYSEELQLEIPGQYHGLHEPKVRYHVKVARVKPEIISLSSKTRPFKLTIIGNNALDYNFLVKFGEDLRQDERIQQIFQQMSDVLRNNKLTHDLTLETFKVIPLSLSCGLIEWLDSTKPLKELLSVEIDQNEIVRVQNNHMILLGENEKGQKQIYSKGFSNLSDERAISEFEKLVKAFPEYALRNALWKNCSSPEQMVHLRLNFAKSISTMSICNWLIGVGDRHSENILIYTDTGHAVGIDFGRAFGFSTELQFPPELIPFRLTPQIINVFGPMKESGWLKQAMIRTLRALKEDPFVLLAMLDVFVLDPCMDWNEHAQNLYKKLDCEVLSQAWYPRLKIEAVEEKFKGANPINELKKDLTSGHKERNCFSRLMQIAEGSPLRNVRGSLPANNLNPEEQVKCLIDLATDPLLLCFTYVGWMPWL